MALINCPECKREVSTMAAACPHCGYPIAKFVGNKTENEQPDEDNIVQTEEPAKPVTRHDGPDVSGDGNDTPDESRSKAKGTIAIVTAIILAGMSYAAYSILGNREEGNEVEAYAVIERFQLENNIDSLEAAILSYKSHYADGAHAELVEQLEQRIVSERKDWNDACAAGNMDAVHAFLDVHPDGLLRDVALARLDSLAFDYAVAAGTLEKYEEYLQHFPDGEYTAEILSKMEEVRNTYVSDEEKGKIADMLASHFRALSSNNREGLEPSVAWKMDSYLGKKDAKIKDVYDYMERIHAGNRSVRLEVSGVNATKIAGDEKQRYNVTFTLRETVVSEVADGELGDSEPVVKTLKGTAIMNEWKRILTLVLR